MSWYEEKPMDNLTLEEFERLQDELFEDQAKIRAAEAELKEMKHVFTAKQDKVIAMMEHFGKTKHSGRMGNVSISIDSFPSTPKNPEAKKAFFDYLKDKGDFDDLITVNSMTLRAYYKQEMEEHSDDPTFNIPGLEPYERKKLSMRRSK